MNINDFLSNISFRLDTWDDYGHKQTAEITSLYSGVSFYVKIFPNDDTNFRRIKKNEISEEPCFLWGQSQEYYQFISNNLENDSDKNRWFELTGDIAYQGKKFIEYYDTLQSEWYDSYTSNGDNQRNDFLKMFDDSFFRDQSKITWQDLLHSLHRMTVNESFLSDYKFTIKKDSQELFEVDVRPKDNISVNLDDNILPMSVSNNVFCIIGENGSGKTHFIRELSKAILNKDSKIKIESIEFDTQKDANKMNKIIYCSFSPFDEKLELESREEDKKLESESREEQERFEYIGLLSYEDTNQKLGDKITDDIMESLKSIKISRKQKLWLVVMNRMSFERWIYDIIYLFQNDIIKGSIDTTQGGSTDGYVYKNPDESTEKIKNLSSGQKIFLLTITKLILKLTQRTVVFIDEPELFLHPPMVKSYVRLISDLVSYVNGLGFIITHSPITLQEFPNNCVKLACRDYSGEYLIKPIRFNTFGENINIINDKIFHIGLQQSGYYNLIERLKFEEDENNLRNLLEFSGSEAKLLINLFLEGISK